MAEVSMAAGDHGEALPLLRKVVEIQPTLTRSRINLAAALVALGRLDEADRLLAGILEEFPRFPLAHFHLGLLRERQGRPAEARAAYVAELEENPRSVVTRFNLGELLLALGDHAGAEEQMRRLIEEDAANPRPYLLLARIGLARPGGLAAAEENARAGLERAREPQLKALGWFLLADVYSRQGRTGEVAAAVEQGERYRALIGSGAAGG
jgi:predicted Zn-dependent protease